MGKIIAVIQYFPVLSLCFFKVMLGTPQYIFIVYY
ncbi:hypothetical protein CJA_0245 [Cellvibrio japonicus Ueda107]|uniref:Uncharacterized protein n=1 Tax=Cellvibrio japonicus (strain Ueda107) TaxID=498211 RepID=B3PGJ0_CELJU|nr:hypothetical protein CJA_0245 [Cellvibrio japonicus Ueda107]